MLFILMGMGIIDLLIWNNPRYFVVRYIFDRWVYARLCAGVYMSILNIYKRLRTPVYWLNGPTACQGVTQRERRSRFPSA